jgi:transposase
MMGTKVRNFMPRVQVSLEELVPKDHFYRHLERSLNLAFVRDLVQPCYAAGGRPSVDPVVFFKLQLVMFFEGLRSERQLLRVAADRLSIRWYVGYDLHAALPDHSSLTKIRDRYGVTIFRRFFDRIVEQCQAAGLVWGSELYLDSTQVAANADTEAMRPRFYIEAINAHLTAIFPDPATDGAEATVASGLPPRHLPVDVSPSRVADLAAWNAARHDWIAELGRPDRVVTYGNYQRLADRWVNRTDPDATLMHKKGGGSTMGYHTHYAVDGGKARIILMALVTPSEVMDNHPMLDLLWHCQFRWHVAVKQVTGDKRYGTTENIVAIENGGVRAYVPLADSATRPGCFSKQAFTYHGDQDIYICPQGTALRRFSVVTSERVINYQAPAASCTACPLKAKCTPSEQGRIVSRSFDELYLDRVRAYHATAGYKKAMRKRKVWVEPLFGEGKAWHGMARFRSRTLPKVNIEGLLIAAGQNLKRFLSWRGWGRRSGPNGAGGVVISAILALFLRHQCIVPKSKRGVRGGSACKRARNRPARQRGFSTVSAIPRYDRQYTIAWKWARCSAFGARSGPGSSTHC